jgi:hypothetical protein
MTAVSSRWSCAAAAALLALGATPAGAQEVLYKCVVRGTVTTSQVPCPGGRVMVTLPSPGDRWEAPPPQDRPVLARRAQQLAPAERSPGPAGQCQGGRGFREK